MELRQIVGVVRKWWWLFLASVLVAAVSAYIGTLGMPRIYRATTTIMIGQMLQQANPNTGDIYTSQQLAQSYADVVQRQPIRAAAAQALGLSYLPSVSARQVSNSQLLEISVLDTDPERARALADEIAHQLILQSPAQSQSQERQAFVQAQLMDLEGRIERTRTQIDEEQARLDAANSARAIQQYQANITALTQRLSGYQSTYATLLVARQGVNTISVIEPATTPEAPVSPNVGQTVLLAAAIGLGLAAGGAFLIEYLDDTIKTPEDVTHTSELPTLGAISRIEGEDYPDKLIAVRHPVSPIVEAYRVLRTNLRFSSLDRPLRAVMVTSPGPTEGKSVTLANLAVVLAQADMRVIVVDTDLRRPVLHRIFGLPNSHGLSDAVLNPNPGVSEHLQATEVENLWLLSSGPLPPNPAEMLGSERMGAMIEELKDRADVVLFDSPPSLVVADAATLGARVDGVLMVNDAGGTRRNEARRAVEQLRRVQANLLGVVLNRMSSRGGSYYYYHYYYYESADGERKKRKHRHQRSWLERRLPFLWRKNGESGQG